MARTPRTNMNARIIGLDRDGIEPGSLRFPPIDSVARVSAEVSDFYTP
jgi:hypothetical protein